MKFNTTHIYDSEDECSCRQSKKKHSPCIGFLRCISDHRHRYQKRRDVVEVVRKEEKGRELQREYSDQSPHHVLLD